MAETGGIYWLASYPKSGNTWFRTFLQNYIEDGAAPVDINELATGQIANNRDWLDEVLGFDTAELSQDEIERLRPEVYRWSRQGDEIGRHKIHDAYSLTADGEPLVSREGTRGALYIIRNPLDVAPSYANHMRMTIDKAIEQMGYRHNMQFYRTDQLYTQVRLILGSWSDHVLSWVEAPGLNRLVIRYEDMQQDPERTFGAAARFLELPEDAERLRKAIRFSAFDVVKAQEQQGVFKERPPGVESFFREGRSGGWRESLTAAQVARIIADHGAAMRRFGYLDEDGVPL